MPCEVETAMAIVVYHNPECGTSRNVVDTIRASGVEPIIIEYIKTGWTRPQLLGLFAAAGITPRGALRTSKSPAEELDLTNPKVDDESLLDALHAEEDRLLLLLCFLWVAEEGRLLSPLVPPSRSSPREPPSASASAAPRGVAR